MGFIVLSAVMVIIGIVIAFYMVAYNISQHETDFWEWVIPLTIAALLVFGFGLALRSDWDHYQDDRAIEKKYNILLDADLEEGDFDIGYRRSDGQACRANFAELDRRTLVDEECDPKPKELTGKEIERD